MTFIKKIKSLIIMACAASITMPVTVYGGGIQGALEEVKVTARKRVETFEDIPITVNVFTEAEIESAGIERPKDFIALTPNATVVQVQGSGNTFINVRGISQNRNTEPSVAILMDGVLLSNPAQFNQELFDIEQIEFLKGPQGALYGRNAIGGAITITTKKPTDEHEGKIVAGIDDGFGYKTQAVMSGPVSADNNLYYRGAVSWKDTDGWIDNEFLNTDADAYDDLAGRIKLLWEPTDNLTADFRASFSQFDGQGFNYRIASTPTNDPTCGGFFNCYNANDNLDVRVVNPGNNEKDLMTISLKLDYETEYGTFTSITAYDDIDEINTGDNYPFLPIAEGGFGLGQSQYFDIQTTAQEFRFTSPQENSFRWSAGAYMLWTDRFVSTGSMLNPAVDVRETPGPTQITFLSDSQDNFAWAVFGDLAMDVTDDFEVGLSLRYDEDERENTTETPNGFLAAFPPGTTFQGEKRKKTWRAFQPKLTTRWHANDDHTIYSSLARGFRSGGFNQSGVGTDPFAIFSGVTDTFDKEVADTIELGLKSSWFDGRLKSNIALYHTWAEGSYYFLFLPASSTQNLGSLDKVTYEGFEIETNALVTDELSINAALGMTLSDIRSDEALGAAVEGNQVPGVSEYTVNLGAQYRTSLDNLYPGVDGFIRTDYNITGKTYWEPSNFTNRKPVDLLDLRFGLDYQDEMSLTFWSKNLLDEDYNTEYSAGGFIYPAVGRQLGVDFQMRF
jgi:iron complex outermembrane recepter protein